MAVTQALLIHFFCETFACINLVIFNYAFHFVPPFFPLLYIKTEKIAKCNKSHEKTDIKFTFLSAFCRRKQKKRILLA